MSEISAIIGFVVFAYAASKMCDAWATRPPESKEGISDVPQALKNEGTSSESESPDNEEENDFIEPDQNLDPAYKCIPGNIHYDSKSMYDE